MGPRILKWGGGFRLKRRFIRLCRHHRRLNWAVKAVRRWGEMLRRRFGPGKRYLRLDGVREERAAPVPKGHVAVYVSEAVVERVVVPLIYVNHPLFGWLLREAQDKYDFEYPGGITLPCHVSELESVRSMIAAGKRWKSKPSKHWDYNY